jgi:internalin A
MSSAGVPPSGQRRGRAQNKLRKRARTLLPGVRHPMKQLLSASLVLTLLAAGSTAVHAGPVKVPDKNLEDALKKVLLEPKEGLTDENLVNVFVLEAVEKGIKDLSGLEKCKNLALLRVTKNEVSDLKPLKDLTNLQSLDLEKNKVSDITPLAGLTKLQYLHLAGNKVAKIDPLKDLTALSALYLSKNEISDLAPLAKLTKLSSLYLDGNKISDLKPLAGITRLSSLDLKENAIVDLSPLAKQTDLKMLFVQKNKITDLKPLVDWLKADNMGEKRVGPYLFLYLADNPLSDEAKTKQVPALEGYGVRLKLKDEPAK